MKPTYEQLEALWVRLNGPAWQQQGRSDEALWGVHNFLTGLGGMRILQLLAEASHACLHCGLPPAHIHITRACECNDQDRTDEYQEAEEARRGREAMAYEAARERDASER